MAGALENRGGMRCLYLYNRSGVCLHYHVWLRTHTTLSPHQDQKLIVNKGNLGVPQFAGQGCSFHSFTTNTYKLSLMETPSGIKLVLVTDPKMGDLRSALKYIYNNIYVEYVVKNPLYMPGQPFRCQLFNSALDQYAKTIQ